MEEKSREQELSVREISLIRELTQIRKEHKRELRLRKTQLSFHLKKMNGNGSQGGKNLEYRYCSIEILC